jgi:hypothetical protein
MGNTFVPPINVDKDYEPLLRIGRVIPSEGLQDAIDDLTSGDVVSGPSDMAQIVQILKDILAELRYDFNRYISLSNTVSANTPKFEIPLNIPARSISIRSSAGVTLNLNSKNSDDIVLAAADPPLSISELPRDSAITKVYVTTGTSAATIQIIAYG